ncbi:MAG TPA: hypothetical protein VH853_11940 [Polyangia bacterium]|nr:hypothetical protein [Polyangia bacterium]
MLVLAFATLKFATVVFATLKFATVVFATVVFATVVVGLITPLFATVVFATTLVGARATCNDATLPGGTEEGSRTGASQPNPDSTTTQDHTASHFAIGRHCNSSMAAEAIGSIGGRRAQRQRL